MTSKVRELGPRTAPARLDTPTDLSPEAVREVSAALNGLVADTFALYVKTKNFHWHVSGPHFRDYHLLLDEQAEQLEGSIDILAERARKIGGTTIRSIANIAKLQRVKDNDKDYVAAIDMLVELMNDNKAQIDHMREAHEVADPEAAQLTFKQRPGALDLPAQHFSRFAADRDANEAVGHGVAPTRAPFGARVNSAKAGRCSHECTAFDETIGDRPVCKRDRDQTAAACHLRLRKAMRWMRCEARIAQSGHLRMLRQTFSDRMRVGAHARMADFERFEAAMYEPRFMRPRCRTGDLAPIAHRADQLRIARAHITEEHIRMSVQRLGIGGHQNIGAELERALTKRRHRCVIDRDHCARRFSVSNDGGDVGQIKTWIRRRLDPHQSIPV